MGRTCDIIGCTNSNYKTKKMSYHSLPSDELLRGLWLDAINANGGFRQSKTRKKTHNCDNTFICGEHFSDDCYIPTSKQKHLKPTAVPTFPPLKKRRCIENDILGENIMFCFILVINWNLIYYGLCYRSLYPWGWRKPI